MTIKQSKVPAIPSVPQNAPPELSMFLNAVKSAIDVIVGDTTSSGVTLEQLDEILRQYTLTGGAAYGGISPTLPDEGGSLLPIDPPDTSIPPAPTGLIATGSLSTVILEWDTLPASPPVAFTTIYRAAVDNFSVAEAVGTTNVLIYSDFVPDVDPYYYWIRFTSEAGIEGPINQTAGVVGQSDPDATGKITVQSLSALTANLGSLSAGELRSPDSTFLIDLANKEILISGPNGRALDDYTLIRNGQIEAWFWTGSTHELVGALRGIQTGIADNGARVLIPGYFRKQPRILVSPADLPSYLTAFQDQDQTMQCVALNVAETVTGSGSWEFDAIARLIVTGGTEIKTPGLSFTDSQSNDQYLSSVTTTSPLVVQLAVGTSVRTYQSTGTAGVYNNRAVTVFLEYQPAAGGSWTVGASVVQQINQETTYVNINLATATIPENQYRVRLRYVFTNTGGQYNGSGGGTQPAQDIVTGSNINESRTSDGTFVGTINTGFWNAPPGATSISVTYQYNYTAICTVQYGFLTGPNTSTITGLGGTARELATATINANNPETNPKTVIQNGVYSASGSGSYNANFLSWRIVNSSQPDSGGLSYAHGQLQATNVRATINYQVPATTDTLPHNSANWNTLTSTLSGTNILTGGTVNWQAIGES